MFLNKSFLRILYLSILIIFLIGCGTKEKSTIEKSIFGNMPSGRPIYSYKLSNSAGLSAELIEYGAILVKLEVPDKKWKNRRYNIGL